MNSTQFLHVYRMTPSGGRVCLVFRTRFSRAQNGTVIDLLGIFIHDGYEHTSQSLVFNDEFKEFADNEMMRFCAMVCSDSRDHFVKRCRYSFETFKSICRNLYVDEKTLMLF